MNCSAHCIKIHFEQNELIYSKIVNIVFWILDYEPEASLSHPDSLL